MAKYGKNFGAGLLFAGGITAIIALTAGRLSDVSLIGQTVPFAYPWRLTEPSESAQITAWLGYALHNLAAWGVLYWGSKTLKWSTTFHPANWAMLGVHLVFAALHWVQTHLFYDGLAAEVPEVTALGSVALLLMVVLAMEAPRRGLFFGKPALKNKAFQRILAKTHGYVFLWALIYTFWYHPTEGTWGHLVGFFYLLMLVWQSVLMFQRAHLNRTWTLFLELMVIPHAVFVALHQGTGLAPMFAYGFGAVFMITQMYGLGWQSTARRVAWGAFFVSMVAVYAWTDQLIEMRRIPAIAMLDYAVVGLMWGAFVLWERMRPRPASSLDQP